MAPSKLFASIECSVCSVCEHGTEVLVPVEMSGVMSACWPGLGRVGEIGVSGVMNSFSVKGDNAREAERD